MRTSTLITTSTTTTMGPAARGTLPARLLVTLTILVLAVCPAWGLRFLGESNTFARFPQWNACPNASISFEFKTRRAAGLLLYTEDNNRYDHLQLSLTGGHVRLWIKVRGPDNQFVDIEANTEPLNDGQWHRVEIARNRMETSLHVDGTQTSKVALGSDSDLGVDESDANFLFFGGVPSGYIRRLDQTLPTPPSSMTG